MNIIELNGWKAITPKKRDSHYLSPKQAAYLLCLAQGMSHKQIARQYGISPNTVTKAMAVIYCKLNVERATSAVAEAMKRGWISPLCALLVVTALLAGGHQIDSRARNVRQPVTSTAKTSAREVAA